MVDVSLSSLSISTTVTNVKFEVEKFDGTNNFGMWQCKVLDILYQRELDIALEEKNLTRQMTRIIKINRQACGAICLCLAKDQKCFIIRETLVKKLQKTLEEKYKKKSLENSLYMKKNSIDLCMCMSMNDYVSSFNKILADFLNLNEKFEDEDKALLNMTISTPLCFIGRIVSHSMLYAVRCTILK